jgi:hypothetical protein
MRNTATKFFSHEHVLWIIYKWEKFTDLKPGTDCDVARCTVAITSKCWVPNLILNWWNGVQYALQMLSFQTGGEFEMYFNFFLQI